MGLWNRIKMALNFLSRGKISNVEVVDGGVVDELVNERNGINIYVRLDGKYYIPTFGDMMKIILTDSVKWSMYKQERFDCDNFSFAFAGMVSWLYDINNVGIAIGNVYDTDGNFLFRHTWNIFIAKKKDGELYMYMYEPQTGMFSSYKSGRILNKIYVPDIIII